MDNTLIPQRHGPCTPSDSTTLKNVIGLYVGGAGTVVALDQAGATASYECSAGQYLTGAFTKVMEATDASLIVILYGAAQ